MPGRVSRSSLPSSSKSSKPKSSHKGDRKRKQRSLNAFAIAQHSVPETTKIRKNRLGEIKSDGQPQRKRQRTSDDEDGDEDEDEEADGPKRKSVKKGRFDELDVSEGSDSDGNQWTYGEVGDEDDSDIDSDEAFGESDEEKFEGFAFRGGKGGSGGASRKMGKKEIFDELDLNEDDEEVDEDEEDDLGEDAIDLATMLDQGGAESAEEEDYQDQASSRTKKPQKAEESEMEDSEEDEEEDEDDLPSEEDDNLSEDEFVNFDDDLDDNDASKQKQLRALVASLPQDQSADPESAQVDSSNAAARMLSALQGMSGIDPTLTKSLKTLSRPTNSSSTAKSSAKEANGLVKVPLPPRQQGRIDRAVAYDKAKETLNRWIDTVKHNRRAEHLTFPLVDPLAQEAQGSSKLLPLDSASKPRNELESTIADILQASGLGGSRGAKSEEEALRGFEELATNKMPLEEVLARRAELRKSRELMFREEARSKRIKKIKSKAYRRVHRKEAAREAEKERDLLAAAGVEASEDEAEAADRRRAEARMGGRHRESRWAKSVKETGRGAWDDDARDAMVIRARKDEEVRMRREGRTIRAEDESGEESGESDEDDEDAGDDEFQLRKQLDRLGDEDEDAEPKSKLSQLAFMQRADAARKRQNEQDIEDMRRELAGEVSDEERQPAETSLGRRIFGPSKDDQPARPQPVPKGEFEEGQSDDEDEDEEDVTAIPAQPTEEQPAVTAKPAAKVPRAQLKRPSKPAKPHVATQAPASPDEEATLDLSLKPSAPKSAAQESSAPTNSDGWTVVHYPNDAATSDNDDDDAPANDAASDTFARSPSPTNLELVQAAFGTSDDTATFAAEKRALTTSEDTQVTSTALPGWGSWTGTGLSRGERSHASRALANPALLQKSTDGVKPQDRTDRKLKNVIVSERRNKKGAKYLAPQLPHGFETRAQYERSLRLPIGPEWTTKETFQQATKPRVLLKKGRVVAPMERPMV